MSYKRWQAFRLSNSSGNLIFDVFQEEFLFCFVFLCGLIFFFFLIIAFLIFAWSDLWLHEPLWHEDRLSNVFHKVRPYQSYLHEMHLLAWSLYDQFGIPQKAQSSNGEVNSSAFGGGKRKRMKTVVRRYFQLMLTQYQPLEISTIVSCIVQLSLVPWPTGSSGGTWWSIQQRTTSSPGFWRPVWAVQSWAEIPLFLTFISVRFNSV